VIFGGVYITERARGLPHPGPPATAPP